MALPKLACERDDVCKSDNSPAFHEERASVLSADLELGCDSELIGLEALEEPSGRAGTRLLAGTGDLELRGQLLHELSAPLLALLEELSLGERLLVAFVLVELGDVLLAGSKPTSQDAGRNSVRARGAFQRRAVSEALGDRSDEVGGDFLALPVAPIGRHGSLGVVRAIAGAAAGDASPELRE